MVATLNDLDALIEEMDNNPHLSPWVVRLILKSIKDKARRMLHEPAIAPAYIENVIDIQALRN